MPAITGTMRRISSATGTASEPGRVTLATDVENVRALLDQSAGHARSAASPGAGWPPSEKLSGVTLTMPMMLGVER